MRLFALAFLALMPSIVTAVAIPAESVDIDVRADASDISLLPRGVLEARDSYDCKGSGLCGVINPVICDLAVNQHLIRNDDINYGAPGSGKPNTGTCVGACGIFIQGPSHCVRSGNQIWWDYQDIRKNNCRICGSKHWGNGCLTTINYVHGC